MCYVTQRLAKLFDAVSLVPGLHTRRCVCVSSFLVFPFGRLFPFFFFFFWCFHARLCPEPLYGPGRVESILVLRLRQEGHFFFFRGGLGPLARVAPLLLCGLKSFRAVLLIILRHQSAMER